MHVIVKKLETLAKVERRISVKILRHLMEMEKRRIHLDMGYTSLFVFLTKHLKYSDGSAYRRIEAMKILRDVPDLMLEIFIVKSNTFLRNSKYIFQYDSVCS